MHGETPENVEGPLLLALARVRLLHERDHVLTEVRRLPFQGNRAVPAVGHVVRETYRLY
ncbi:hypothetical protein DPMN_166780 [Dreissena polymorpha]|uniref:Uncharacterized protein n=1 Tax=Dreissena polymorpha TaxID=45954 RepID=A0A9D4EZ90_DREPO|nr:hypothetical protein DPMN_166780 [Dreissena polymorpha]